MKDDPEPRESPDWVIWSFLLGIGLLVILAVVTSGIT